MTRKTQGERMVVMETNINNIKDDIKDIKSSLHDHVEKQDAQFKEMRASFAGKWIEKGFWLLLTAIIGMSIKIVVG